MEEYNRKFDQRINELFGKTMNEELINEVNSIVSDYLYIKPDCMTRMNRDYRSDKFVILMSIFTLRPSNDFHRYVIISTNDTKLSLVVKTCLSNPSVSVSVKNNNKSHDLQYGEKISDYLTK